MESGIMMSFFLMAFVILFTLNGAQGALDLTTKTANVAESAAVGDTVMTLAGTGGTGSPTYTYTLTTNTNFEILETSKLKVKTGNNLDHETAGTLTVSVTVDTAADDAVVVPVVITVTDVNEAPTFAKTVESTVVGNGAAATTKIVQVMATDQDDSTNGQITYTIDSGNGNGVLAIDGSTGYISVAASKTINTATQSAFALSVKATDGGSLSATLPVYIAVQSCSGVAKVTAGVSVLVTMFIAMVMSCF